MTYVLCVSCIFEITRSSMFMFLPLKLAKELDFSWNWIWCDGILIKFIKKIFFSYFWFLRVLERDMGRFQSIMRSVCRSGLK